MYTRPLNLSRKSITRRPHTPEFESRINQRHTTPLSNLCSQKEFHTVEIRFFSGIGTTPRTRFEYPNGCTIYYTTVRTGVRTVICAVNCTTESIYGDLTGQVPCYLFAGCENDRSRGRDPVPAGTTTKSPVTHLRGSAHIVSNATTQT